MKLNQPGIIETPSIINYPYATIRVTQSRLSKGLIAVPVSLAGWFPGKNETIQIFLDDSIVSQNKNYSSYSSSTRECRIGGVRDWFQQNKIKSDDEIVIQLLDKEHFIYRLIPERSFLSKTQELQRSFDSAKTERDASEEILTLAQWTNLDKDKVVFNEYSRLANAVQSKERQYIKQTTSRARESVPANLRTVLRDIYKGHCQLCDFWFLRKDKEPYFEVHHLDPVRGHHPKNLIVVCGNCHNEFEYADVKQEFDDEQWLIGVHFNRNRHSVNQAIFSRKTAGVFKELFI